VKTPHLRGFHGASGTRTRALLSAIQALVFVPCSHAWDVFYDGPGKKTRKSKEPTPGLEPGTPSLRVTGPG
jgi:hypothetical protein